MIEGIGQFARIPGRAAGAKDLSARDFRVYVAIALHADVDGLAFPSLARIASLTGISRSNLCSSIRRLEKGGYLRHWRRKGESGTWANSIYEIILREPAEVIPFNGTASPEMPIGIVTDARGGIPHDAQSIKKQEQSDESSRQVAENMLTVWREECADALLVPQRLDRDRLNACQARFRDSFNCDIEQWRAVCRAIRQSPFCCGQGERGWCADFDWALKPNSIRKIREGKYRPRERPLRRRAVNDAYGIPPLGPGGT